MIDRDIGTVVMPNADLRISLDASREGKARQCHLGVLERRDEAHHEGILRGMRRRDRIDSSRAAASLKAADDVLTANERTIQEASSTESGRCF